MRIQLYEPGYRSGDKMSSVLFDALARARQEHGPIVQQGQHRNHPFSIGLGGESKMLGEQGHGFVGGFDNEENTANAGDFGRGAWGLGFGGLMDVFRSQSTEMRQDWT
jgi:hypothetical protein